MMKTELDIVLLEPHETMLRELLYRANGSEAAAISCSVKRKSLQTLGLDIRVPG